MPTAYLFCPAYPLQDQAQWAAAVTGARSFADAIAHDLVVSPDLARWGGSGHWHDASSRRADLERALAHDVVLPARGGYGCIDLLGTIDAHRDPLPLLLGYSDLTVLHACWRRRARESLYGFMPAVTRGPRSLESAATLARGEAARHDGRSVGDVAGLAPGVVTGPLFAACLRVLASLSGTAAMPDLSGCILALEDIDERPYQVDRDLTQLHLAGSLGGVRGLIFGTFRCPPRPGYDGPGMAEICQRWADRLAIPSIGGFPFGHEDDPIALPCGREASLRVDGSGWSLSLPPRGRD